MTLTLPRHTCLIAHGGVRGVGPGNTLEAIRRAAQGADMIEVDVQLTADGVPILWHDPDLASVTGRPDELASIRYDDLRSLERRARRGGSRYRLATLAAAERAVSPRLPFNLEIKPQGLAPEAVANALRPVVTSGRPVLVSSFDWTLLTALRRLFSFLPLAPLGHGDASGLVAVADDLDAFSIHASTALAPTLLAASPPSARPLFFFTVNQVRAARNLIRLGARGVFTDRPSRLRRALGAQ